LTRDENLFGISVLPRYSAGYPQPCQQKNGEQLRQAAASGSQRLAILNILAK